MSSSPKRIWTDLHACLEQRGEFKKLIALDPNDVELETRLIAGRARAHAAIGEIEQSIAYLRLLQESAIHLDAETACVSILAQAFHARHERNWARALELARRAQISARESGSKSLWADALFAEAFALAEQGTIHWALHLYQQIEDNPDVPAYRRGLARTNLTLILCDMGRLDEVEAMIDCMPVASRPGAQLLLDAARAEKPALEFVLQDFGPLAGLPFAERFRAAVIIVEARELFGLKSEPDARLIATLEEAHASSSAGVSETALTLLTLLGRSESEGLGADTNGWDWRSQITYHFSRALLEARRSPALALGRYLGPLAALCDKLHLNTPLIPRVVKGRLASGSPWAQALWAKLKIKPRTELAPPNAARFRLQGSKLNLMDTQGGLDLARSPQMEQLIRSLAGPPGRRIKKKELHERLTASRYNPQLHDARLRQLFSRLERTLKANGLPSLAKLPRDHTVLVLANIELDEEPNPPPPP